MTDWRFMLHQLRRNPLSLAGIIILLIFVIIAVFAPLIAPPPEGHRDPYMIPRDGYSPVPQSPSGEHHFGTTEGQYDIFYGVVWGTRSAFKVGLGCHRHGPGYRHCAGQPGRLLRGHR